jgi:hypothetical protein
MNQRVLEGVEGFFVLVLEVVAVVKQWGVLDIS